MLLRYVYLCVFTLVVLSACDRNRFANSVQFASPVSIAPTQDSGPQGNEPVVEIQHSNPPPVTAPVTTAPPQNLPIDPINSDPEFVSEPPPVVLPVVPPSPSPSVAPSPSVSPSPIPAAPTISAIAPNIGTTGGNAMVQITGTGFWPGLTVSFGGSSCNVSAQSSTVITCSTPRHRSGWVDVTVTNPNGNSFTKPMGYYYQPLTSHIMFYTSQFFDGNLGGLAGADQKCQDAADSAGLGGLWMAILSSDSVNARDRVQITGSIYNNTNTNQNTEMIAANASQLWSGSLATSVGVNYNEFRQTEDAWRVHTGSTVSGIKITGKNCNNWTSSNNADMQMLGVSRISSQWWIWSTFNQFRCDSMYKLYCINQ